MFTGLIKDIGVLCARRELGGDGIALRLATALSERLAEGDSLAVDGVCLTLTRIGAGEVEATCVAETLRRSTMGALSVGARCNLEPALAVGDALGGHFVQGHVDGLGRVRQVQRLATGQEVEIALPAALMRYVVVKGSLAVNGVSLTVWRVSPTGAWVALVPHTLSRTTLGNALCGQQVNIEVDILAKYVERLVAVPTEAARPSVNEAWLREHGFA